MTIGCLLPTSSLPSMPPASRGDQGGTGSLRPRVGGSHDLATAGTALCKLLSHSGSLSGQEDGPRPLLVFKPTAGSLLTAWPWASHSTFQGLSVV